jgi:hypothetical protein
MSEPTFTNADEAAAALAASIEADNSGQPSPVVPEAPQSAENQPVAERQPASQESPAQQDSFTDLEAALQALPDEAQHVVRERFNQMQGDYTRKTQEVAAQRAEAEQAIQFVQQLQSDPNFALEVHRELATALEEAGYTASEAQAEASRQVAEAATPGEPTQGEFDDPVAAQVQELSERLAAFEAEQVTRELENEFDRQDVAVRQANPKWEEEDMQHVYALSYATQGNLIQAADLYKKEQERLIAAFLAQKEAVGSGTPDTPGATGSAQGQPEPFTDLMDPRLARAAERMLNESLNQ